MKKRQWGDILYIAQNLFAIKIHDNLTLYIRVSQFGINKVHQSIHLQFIYYSGLFSVHFCQEHVI